MTSTTASQAFVNAAAAMVQHHDVADTLARLLDDCAKFTAADAIGLLVKNDHDELELLSATSHQMAELELYQLQHDTGPCIDAVRDESALTVCSGDDITERWGSVGEAIVTAGFHAVHAVPLRWHGYIIGAMGSFHTDPSTVDEETQLLSQAFADIATVVIVQSTELTSSQLNERVSAALAGRTIIEQAKGVLAQTTGVDMATAYRLLAERAADNHASLTDTATHIIQQAQQRT
jgi:transcriptional regulator with GAF, ATPase, and Fis domain